MAEVAPALDFVAITDPGSALAELARAQEFRGIVEAPPDVGGRYSALSVFGLVPAALAGVDVGGLLERARAMADACRAGDAADNPGSRSGATIGEAALAGRDKLTILTSPRLAAFGDWAEQLIAESTGKAGTGHRADRRRAGRRAAERYGDDRSFVVLTLAGESARLSSTRWPASWGASGTRCTRIGLADPLDDRRRVRALGGGHRGRRHRPRHRSLRPAERPGEQGRDEGAARGVSDARARCRSPIPLVERAGPGGHAPTRRRSGMRRSASTARSTQLLDRRPRGRRLRRDPRLPAARSRRSRTPAAPSASRSATPWRRRRRSASARASCTPPGSCTRAGRTAASSCSSPPTRPRTCRSPAGTRPSVP